MTIRTTMTSKTFRIFWITNGESMQNPIPPIRPYHRPLYYLGYVKDSNPDVHVRVFKVVIRINGEIEDAKIVNLFGFTLKDFV
jgi:hypothetical protein